MLYIGKNLDDMYKELKNSGLNDNIPIKIYAINYDTRAIMVDINKSIRDLPYLSLQAEFFQIEFEAPKVLKKFTDLSIENLLNMFLDILPENNFSLYSENMSDEEYEQIIKNLKDFCNGTKWEIYSFFYYLEFFLENKKNKKKKIKLFGSPLTHEEAVEKIKELFNKEKIIRNINNNNLIGILEKFYQEGKDFSINLMEDLALDNYLYGKKNIKFFYTYITNTKDIKKFLEAYNFICKPIEKIKEEDIKKILKMNFELTSSILTEKIKLKLEIIKTLVLEKSYEYFFKTNTTSSEADIFLTEIKNELENKINNTFLEYVIKELFELVGTTAKRYDSNNIISRFLINIKNLPEAELKYFSFNNFFRSQLYYKNKFLKMASEEIKFLNLNKNPLNKKLKISNSYQILRGEREFGEDNLEKLLIYLNNKNKEKEIIDKKIKDIKLYYNLLQKYKNLSSFSFENYTLEKFIRYNEVYNFFKNCDFSLKISPRGSYLYGRYILKFTYYSEKVSKYNVNEDYVVRLKDGSLELMKYLGECDNKLCFFKESNLQIFLKEEIEIHQIKSLVFAEDTTKKTKTLF